VPATHITFADRQPEVAATWNEVKNGVTTAQILASDEGWWRCREGHEWFQTVRSRIAMPKWKAGDKAACRECLGHGFWGQYACECDQWFATSHARDNAIATRCPGCTTLTKGRTHAEKVLTTTGADALLSTIKNRPRPTTTIPGIDFDPHATPPLIGNWCRIATNRIQDLRGLGYALTDDRARATVEEVHHLAHHITPEPDDVHRAIEDNDLVSIPLTSERMWPAGWQWHRHAITQPTPRPGEEHQVAATIVAHITAGAVETSAHRHHWKVRDLTSLLTAQTTQALTEHDPTGRVHNEALIPLVAKGGSQSGALDLVLCRGNGPDIVVEIDSKHKRWSTLKLTYARQAGALTIWIRFGEGRVAPLTDGTLVVDARDTAAALMKGRTPSQGGTRVVSHEDGPPTLFDL
jgi:hypothetical protein